MTKINFILSQLGTSSGDTIADPTFVPWNIVQCRLNTQIILDLTESNANGVIVAADIFVLESRKHTIFSFRNKGTLDRGFTVEIHLDYTVQVWRNDGGWTNPVTSAIPLNLGKFNPFFL